MYIVSRLIDEMENLGILAFHELNVLIVLQISGDEKTCKQFLRDKIPVLCDENVKSDFFPPSTVFVEIIAMF